MKLLLACLYGAGTSAFAWQAVHGALKSGSDWMHVATVGAGLVLTLFYLARAVKEGS